MVSLRARLKMPGLIVAPGCYDALSALLIERAGFEAAYVSGASIAYTRLGRPDIGLVSFSELADIVAAIRERVSIPLIVDMDTGFGNALNVQRSVKLLAQAGASALQLEDQVTPKRCGHLADKSLVSAAEMCGKIRAALDARPSDEMLLIARTDAIAVEGFAAAIDRAEAYLAAGADVLFVEAPQTDEQLAAIGERFRRPRAAPGQHGGRRQDAAARRRRTREARLLPRDLPRRHGTGPRASSHRLFREPEGARHDRAVPRPHARLQRHQRHRRHGCDARSRKAL